jgi:hypothetical protein
MEKEKIIVKAQEVLSPFETEQIVRFLKDLTIKTIFENPLVLGILIVVFFFAVVKRSKFVLLFLFTLLALMALVHFALPTGNDMNAMAMIPFAFGCLGIGAVLIYFIFIKVE